MARDDIACKEIYETNQPVNIMPSLIKKKMVSTVLFLHGNNMV